MAFGTDWIGGQDRQIPFHDIVFLAVRSGKWFLAFKASKWSYIDQACNFRHVPMTKLIPFISCVVAP